MADASTKTNGATEGKRNVSVIQIGGGDPTAPARRKSSTRPVVTSFVGDERHFDVTITTVNNEVEETNENKKTQVEDAFDPKFGTTTLSRSAPVAEKIQEQIRRESSVLEHFNGTDKSDHDTNSQSAASDHSELSDEPSSSSSSHDYPEATSQPSSWMSFAQSLFSVKGSSSYCCAPLQQPLLTKREKSDHLASLASWAIILRIMGDLPESDSAGDRIEVAGQSPPVPAQIRESYHKKYNKKQVEDTHRKYTEMFKNPNDTDIRGLPFVPERLSSSMLEKVQFICSLGIYRPEMRDELYCQVCRQLTNNPSRNSTVRGWVLLSLLAGSFAPSELFSPCFLQFLQECPSHFASRVEKLLRRTFTVGTRGFPPSWLEFQATKNCKPILLPVALMNGQRMLIDADSVTTVQEICTQVSQRISLEDPTGFSIYVTLMNRISCLGNGQHRIMDAVAECEQHTKQMGRRENNSTWRLYFRKEYFTPWQDSRGDTIGTDLVYQQVMRGISVGEYKCEKDEVLILMAAQRYYVENSTNMSDDNLKTFLTGWLPQESKKEKDLSYWIENVSKTLKTDILQNKVETDSLKSDIVTFARNKWFAAFSRFYDASKIHGPATTWPNVIIGLNCRGVHVMDEAENLKNQISFVEIATVARGRHYVTISTVKGEDYVVFSHHSEDFFQLVSKFLDGLKRKSKYGLIVQDCSQFEGAIGASLQKGDLVILDQPYEHFTQSDVFSGTCQRTEKLLTLPRDIMYILPIIEAPTKDMLGMTTMQLRKEQNPFLSLTSGLSKEPTLEEYSKVNFRPSGEKRMSKIFSRASQKKKEKATQIWQFSKEALKKPLLRRTLAREELRRTCCRTFLAIQQYMGDSPKKEQIADEDLVNIYIIEPSMRSRHVREETFCQIMKQLTDNPERSSLDRGWQLLYALSMICIPGSDVYEECDSFMKGSTHRFAKTCREMLRKTKMSGSRQYPLHIKEYQMIWSKNSTMQIEVAFPFKSVESFNFEPGARVFDIKLRILEKLKLSNYLDYGLFFGLRDRGSSLNNIPFLTMINACDGDYLMDSMTHVERFWAVNSSAGNRTSQGGPLPPEQTPRIFFMKKLWIHAEPGIDKVADRLFHFPQELPNYLRGYHMSVGLDVPRMAAYIYRAQFGDDMSILNYLDENLHALIPKTQLQARTIDEWKKAIDTTLKATRGKSEEEMKEDFLRVLYKLDTYGSVFFEVKQRSLKTMPSNILLAVNANGVVFIDPDSKNTLAKYEYSQIPNWAFDEYSFTFVVNDSSSSSTKILIETNLGHNLDDVVMSYVAWMMNTHIRRRPTYSGVTVGESVC